MPELRWTLLILGGLFIVGLAVWEFRRQRQAPRQNASSGTPSGPEWVTPTMDSGAEAGPRVHREPTISLPELHPEPRVESRPSARREPAHDPPVVEVDDASFSRLQNEADGSALTAYEFSSADVASHDADTVAMSVEDAHHGYSWADPGVSEAEDHLSAPDGDLPGEGAVDAEAAGSAGAAASAGTVASEGAPPIATSAGATISQAAAAASGIRQSSPPSDHQPVGFATDDNAPEAAPPPKAIEPHPVGASADGAPIVEWPRENSRKIVALRLVSAPAARFPGRAVRQALAAEGFVLGKFDIFHKPGPDDRAVLSAASLSKPGTFTMNTIDAQRFGGISLFAVLPGPLPAQQTFDELLTTARSLNDRLQGALQDERGEPLTPMRSATIRQSLCDGSESADYGGGAGSETRQ